MAWADRCDMTLRRVVGQPGDQDMLSIWSKLARPREKYSGAGPTYNRLNRERKEGEKVAKGFAVARNWGNSQGASCFAIPWQ
jgi:hypothetical protein